MDRLPSRRLHTQPDGRTAISREPFDSAGSQLVVAQAEGELVTRYGFVADVERGLSAAQFDPPTGVFLVTRRVPGDEVVGGVGLRPSTASIGEIKRLWVHPDARGLGLARALMDQVEQVARALGYTALRLETGSRQPEAVALYASLGWNRQEEAWAGGPIRCGSIHFDKDLARP